MTQVTIEQELLGRLFRAYDAGTPAVLHCAVEDLRAALQAAPAQPEPNLSSLKPDTQKAIREWIADGSFVERAIGTMREQECEIVRLEKAQTVNQALVNALKQCRDRFFPANQPERDRDLLWEPVNAALAQAQAQPAQGPKPTNCRNCGGADNVLCGGQCRQAAIQKGQQS